MLVLQGSVVKSLHEQGNLMSRFLLVAGSLAQFCMVLCALRRHWRCLEWFTGSLSLCSGLMRRRELFDLFHRSKMYLAIVLMLFSLSAQWHFYFFLLLCACCFCSSQSGPVCEVSGLCYINTCIHGLTQFKADLGYISVVWASVRAASLGSTTMLTKFLKKYLLSSYFAACHTLVRIRKISAQGFF